jgi:hypothetical protein
LLKNRRSCPAAGIGADGAQVLEQGRRSRVVSTDDEEVERPLHKPVSQMRHVNLF